jgi:hypothetical protein
MTTEHALQFAVAVVVIIYLTAWLHWTPRGPRR